MKNIRYLPWKPSKVPEGREAKPVNLFFIPIKCYFCIFSLEDGYE
jgi:hypothetical protein